MAWQKRLNSPPTSAVGRLFDGASSLLLDLHTASFEGQGPLQLEAMATAKGHAVSLELQRDAQGLYRTNWHPLIAMLTNPSRTKEQRAADFHASLAQALVAQVKQLSEHYSFDAVGLTGGVFQNRLLSKQIIKELARQGRTAYLPQRLPVNDGGLCYGQIIETVFLDKQQEGRA